jgi:hypothetical protein
MHRHWLDQSIIRLTLPSAEEGERSNARRQSQTISGLAALSPSAVQRPERNHHSINQRTPLIVLLVKVFRNRLLTTSSRHHSHTTTTKPPPHLNIQQHPSDPQAQEVFMYPLNGQYFPPQTRNLGRALSAGRVRLSLVSRAVGKGFPSKRSACVGMMPVKIPTCMRRSTRGREVQRSADRPERAKQRAIVWPGLLRMDSQLSGDRRARHLALLFMGCVNCGQLRQRLGSTRAAVSNIVQPAS